MADARIKRIPGFIKPFRVEPGRRVRLPHDFDSAGTREVSVKEAKEILRFAVGFLAEYQMRLAAQDTHGVVMVLQAMDAAGKDGTIRHVMSGVNPQGVQVSSFKIPSSEDLDHDYLWRYQRRLAGARQHRDLQSLLLRGGPRRPGPPADPGQARSSLRSSRTAASGSGASARSTTGSDYLTDQGYRFVKIFLNVGKEEQRRRFLTRIDESDRNWKFSANDAKERLFWDDYQKAFSEVLSNTSTPWAPWYVVPADDKPFARVAAAAILAHTLMDIDPRFPRVSKEAKEALAAAKVELEGQAPEGRAAPIRSRPSSPRGREEVQEGEEVMTAAAAPRERIRAQPPHRTSPGSRSRPTRRRAASGSIRRPACPRPRPTPGAPSTGPTPSPRRRRRRSCSCSPASTRTRCRSCCWSRASSACSCPASSTPASSCSC